MEHFHFKVYKPFGMLSQLTSGEDRQLRKKRFLSELSDFPEGTMPVGRLDEKSEGLLLMTTDGKWSDDINRSGIEKQYLVQLDGLVTTDAIDKLSEGVVIGLFGKKYETLPCDVDYLKEEPILPEASAALRIGRHRPTSWISMVIKEGKYRQIRKMTAAVGFPTVRLVRIRIGDISLGQMKPSQVLKITPTLLSS
ncbi:23S rRNA pseudouridine2457 synthase [Maribacter dokdonensis]|uniref:pseudouridine synthase n=1 Tax=Maribacter dokdonensis TaxID=320912 RepID=UPI001B1F1F55|nr:pseudouridine synthase [Maribacter dokdonensis]CAG2532531.1 23S rRNA pseudouridine2457 synthase [Maribacter dokdonensis]|tara:strand:- start:120 stop:704 length:585 start_codon:yes stop_codon:yes gene_type:complete